MNMSHSDPFGLVFFLDSVKQMFGHTVHRTHQAAATAADSLICSEDAEQILRELDEEETHWITEDKSTAQPLRSPTIDPFMGAQPASVHASE